MFNPACFKPGPVFRSFPKYTLLRTQRAISVFISIVQSTYSLKTPMEIKSFFFLQSCYWKHCMFTPPLSSAGYQLLALLLYRDITTEQFIIFLRHHDKFLNIILVNGVSIFTRLPAPALSVYQFCSVYKPSLGFSVSLSYSCLFGSNQVCCGCEQWQIKTTMKKKKISE